MRQIVLDTETTGLEPEQGHRIIEIGCVELLNRKRTGQTFHRYLRPDREIEPGAVDVHGLDAAFLADKPAFDEVVDEFLAFVQGAELVIHNASFDIAFLDAELARLSLGKGRAGSVRRMEKVCTVLDTLAVARKLHPGQRCSLDALCNRYGVDNSRRELHGALLDAEILLDVYLAMTGGQVALLLDTEQAGQNMPQTRRAVDRTGLNLVVVRASDDELAAHRQRLAHIEQSSGGKCLWREFESILSETA